MLGELKQSKIRGYLNFLQLSYFVKDCDRMLDRSHLGKESFHLGSCVRGCRFVMAEGVLGGGVVTPPWFEHHLFCSQLRHEEVGSCRRSKVKLLLS